MRRVDTPSPHLQRYALLELELQGSGALRVPVTPELALPSSELQGPIEGSIQPFPPRLPDRLEIGVHRPQCQAGRQEGTKLIHRADRQRLLILTDQDFEVQEAADRHSTDPARDPYADLSAW